MKAKMGVKKCLALCLGAALVLTACQGGAAAGGEPADGTAATGAALSGSAVSESPQRAGEEKISPEKACCPDGWKIFARARGEYGTEDYRYLFVIYQSKKKLVKNEVLGKMKARRLTVIREHRDGTYEVAAENENAVLKEGEGGMLIDPYDSIGVKDGKFILTFYGGSAWRWWVSYTFSLSGDNICLEQQYHKYGRGLSGSEKDISEAGVRFNGEMAEFEVTDYRRGTITTERKIRKKGKNHIKTKEKKIKKQDIDIRDFNIYKIPNSPFSS